jgi:ABC-type oligopeptide transport system substrate-binding subunit
MIATAAGEGNSASRLALLRSAEQYLVKDQAPIAPLFFYVGIQLYDGQKFGGIEANVLDEHPIREIFRKNP